MKITAYIRCSTNKQDEASQRQIIGAAALAGGYTVDEWVSDTASGGTPWQERQLAHILDDARTGEKIIISEVSRIARSTIGVLTFLEAAAKKGVSVNAIKSGIKLDGSTSSKIVVAVLAIAAEIERDLLRERTRAALQARKAAGLPIGRQAGALGLSKKLTGKESEIDKLVSAGVSQAAIGRIMGVSRQTIFTHQKARKESETKNGKN